MQWFNTFNFAYLQVIYNHIDYVSHYFRKYGHCTLMTSFPYYYLLKPISRDNLRWRKLS